MAIPFYVNKDHKPLVCDIFEIQLQMYFSDMKHTAATTISTAAATISTATASISTAATAAIF